MQQQQTKLDPAFADELISTLIAVSVVTKSLAKKIMAEDVKDTKGGEEDGKD